MSYATPEQCYGIETVADAVFTLKQSWDDGDHHMAANPHSFTPKVIISAARRLAKAKVAQLAARRPAPVLINDCPF